MKLYSILRGNADDVRRNERVPKGFSYFYDKHFPSLHFFPED